MADITQFRKEYMWGFTQGYPIKHSKDKEAFNKLMTLVSKTGAISIGATFHPYHLLDGKGNDLWEIFLKTIEINNSSVLEILKDKKKIYHLDVPSAEQFQIVKWDDERLFVEHNPEFGKFVPFVLPFISYNDGEDPLWLTKLQEGLKEKYTAKDFIDKVNDAVRFFLPQPTFILGIDEFDKDNSSQLIDHYVNFLENVIKHKE